MCIHIYTTQSYLHICLWNQSTSKRKCSKGIEGIQEVVMEPDFQKQLSIITLQKKGMKDTRERCEDYTGFESYLELFLPMNFQEEQRVSNQIKVINRRKIFRKILLWKYFSLFVDKKQYWQSLQYHFGPFPDKLFPFTSICFLILSLSYSHHSAILDTLVLSERAMRHSQGVSSA